MNYGTYTDAKLCFHHTLTTQLATCLYNTFVRLLLLTANFEETRKSPEFFGSRVMSCFPNLLSIRSQSPKINNINLEIERRK